VCSDPPSPRALIPWGMPWSSLLPPLPPLSLRGTAVAPQAPLSVCLSRSAEFISDRN